MIKRIALLVGSIAAAGVLALGLAAAGFGPVATNADQADPAALAELDVASTDALIAEPVVQVQTETVYVRPPAAPKVIHVTKKVPAVRTQTTQKSTKRSWDGEDDDDDEHEHEDHEREDHEREDHEREDD